MEPGASDVNSALAATFCSPVGLALAFVWGTVWGSFHNVVIVWALGKRRSPVVPASHCLMCGTPIKAWDNIPILSYFILRGRCRACGGRFSARYVVVEILGGLLALALFARFVHGVCSEADIPSRLAAFLVYEKFAGLLVILAAVDLERLVIPDKLTYPAIPAAMLLSLLLPLPAWWDGLVGAVAGYAILRLVSEAYFLLRGREGMGLGDAKLLAIIGAVLGWRALPYVIFLASLQGSIVGIVGALVGSRLVRPPGSLDAEEPADTAASSLDGETAPGGEARPGGLVRPDASPVSTAGALRLSAVPFGPFLALAALEILLLGHILGRLLMLPGL